MDAFKLYASFNAGGEFVGFYSEEFSNVPSTGQSVEITPEQHAAFLDAINSQGLQLKLVAGKIEQSKRAVTDEQLFDSKRAVVQNLMDVKARAMGYDNIGSAITYAEEPAVAKFQSEGQALRAWRSLVWAACYAVLDDVKAGKRAVPTDAELLALLPEFSL